MRIQQCKRFAPPRPQDSKGNVSTWENVCVCVYAAKCVNIHQYDQLQFMTPYHFTFLFMPLLWDGVDEGFVFGLSHACSFILHSSALPDRYFYYDISWTAWSSSMKLAWN